MNREKVFPHGVSLQFVGELWHRIEQKSVARGVDLVEVKGKVITGEGLELMTGQTLELMKRGSFISMAKAKIPQTRIKFEVPRSKLAAKSRSHWNMRDVVDQVIVPEVVERNVAYAVTLDPSIREVDDRTEYSCYYVSVPEEARFSKLVEALNQNFKNENPKSIFLWLDMFNASQIDMLEDDFRKDYEFSIEDRVAACLEHMVYMPRWGFKDKNPRPTSLTFENGQILWEILMAAEHGKTTTIILSKEGGRELRNSFRDHGLKYFEDLMKYINVDKSVSLYNLKQLMEEKDETADSFHEKVGKHLEVWFAREFAAEAPKILSKKDTVTGPTAKAANRVAVVLTRNGDVEAASSLFDHVIEFMRLLKRLGTKDKDPALAFALNNKALILEKQEKLDEAIPLLKEAIDILSELDNTEARVAVIVTNLVQLLESLDREAQAESYLVKLVELRKAQSGASSVECALALNRLGRLQTKLGKLDDAKENLLEALGILEKATEVAEDDPKLEKLVDDLATVYDLETNHTLDDGSNHHLNVANALLNLAKAYKQTHGEDSEGHGSKGLNILKDVLGKDHPEVKKYEEDLLSN